MSLPRISATGRLTADPEVRFTNSGKSVTSFSVACNERIKQDSGEWKDGSTTFLTVKLWEKPGEQAAETLRKGTLVHVEGLLRQDRYDDKGGNPRTVYEVVRASVFLGLDRPLTPDLPPAPF